MTRYIDADELKDWSEIIPLTDDGGIDINDFEEKLRTMPTIDAVPVRHGHWIGMDEQSYTWKVRCSVCGHERSMLSTQGEYPNYCENCGAKMYETQKKPCDDCQEFDCYGCEYSERKYE